EPRPRVSTTGTWQGLAKPAPSRSTAQIFLEGPKAGPVPTPTATAPVIAREPTVATAPTVAAERNPIVRLEAAAKQMHLGDFDGALAAVLALTRDEPEDLDALLTLGNLHS